MEISLAEFCRQEKVAKFSIQKAITDGRITACRTEQRGQKTRVFLNYEEAKEQWLSNTDPRQRFRADVVAKRADAEQQSLRARLAQAGKNPKVINSRDYPAPDEIAASIESLEFLQLMLPDFTGQLLAPVRAIGKTIIANIPASLRAVALGDVIEFLVAELRETAIDELEGKQS